MFEASIATKKVLRPNPPNSHIVGNVSAGNQPIFSGCSRDIVKVLAITGSFNVRFTPGSGHSGNIAANDRL